MGGLSKQFTLPELFKIIDCKRACMTAEQTVAELVGISPCLRTPEAVKRQLLHLRKRDFDFSGNSRLAT